MEAALRAAVRQVVPAVSAPPAPREDRRGGIPGPRDPRAPYPSLPYRAASAFLCDLGLAPFLSKLAPLEVVEPRLGWVHLFLSPGLAELGGTAGLGRWEFSGRD